MCKLVFHSCTFLKVENEGESTILYMVLGFQLVIIVPLFNFCKRVISRKIIACSTYLLVRIDQNNIEEVKRNKEGTLLVWYEIVVTFRKHSLLYIYRVSNFLAQRERMRERSTTYQI